MKGRARYLLELNEHLRRSLTERWKRWKPAWTPSDGLVDAQPTSRGPRSTDSGSRRAPYSLTALQRYASCPYQFLLQAIYRLEPFEEPTPLQRLDPLTKGGLFHAIQTAFFRERQSGRRAAASRATNLADEPRGARPSRVAGVRARERDLLAPAVDRVWRDEIAALRKDLRRWVMLQAECRRRLAARAVRVELRPAARRGSRSAQRRRSGRRGRPLRAARLDRSRRTAHRLARAARDRPQDRARTARRSTTTVNGGRTLQPVLYSLVVEEMTHEPVTAGRLYYCTQAGGLHEPHGAARTRSRARPACTRSR